MGILEIASGPTKVQDGMRQRRVLSVGLLAFVLLLIIALLGPEIQLIAKLPVPVVLQIVVALLPAVAYP